MKTQCFDEHFRDVVSFPEGIPLEQKATRVLRVSLCVLQQCRVMLQRFFCGSS